MIISLLKDCVNMGTSGWKRVSVDTQNLTDDGTPPARASARVLLFVRRTPFGCRNTRRVIVWPCKTTLQNRQ